MKNKIINMIAKLDNGPHSSDQLQGIDEALTILLETEVAKYKDALIWCSGNDDFQVGGKARVGWEKICVPLIEKICNPFALSHSLPSVNASTIYEDTLIKDKEHVCCEKCDAFRGHCAHPDSAHPYIIN